MDVASVRGPVTVTEDMIGEVTAVCVISESVVLPRDEEGRAVSVVVGCPGLCKEETVGVRVPSVPEVAASEEMAVVDKVTVGWPFKEVRLGVLREEGMVAMVTGCVVTVLLVSEVSRMGEGPEAGVSVVLVAKVEVREGMLEGE